LRSRFPARTIPDWFATMLDDFHLSSTTRGARRELREAEACCRLLERGYQSSASGRARLALVDPLPNTPPSDPSVGARRDDRATRRVIAVAGVPAGRRRSRG
jgi:hypothetical protein